MSQSLTYAVIANWNGKQILHRCLRSIFANTKSPNFKVIVVDNGSTDGSVKMLLEKFSSVEIITNAQNLGFSQANNQGIRHALQRGARYILLLNNDVEITDKQWLETLISTLRSGNDVGIVGCKLLYPDGKIQHAGGIINLTGGHNRGECQEDKGQYNKVEQVDFVTGAVLLIRSEVIRKIGILDVEFTPLYYEDTDWCVRAKLYGYKVIYTPTPTLIHHCGSSANKLNQQRKMLYLRKSFIRFFLLNFRTTNILKRLIVFETRILAACFVARAKNKGFPVTLRPDAPTRLLLFFNVWYPSIRRLKKILALRKDRFRFGLKLSV